MDIANVHVREHTMSHTTDEPTTSIATPIVADQAQGALATQDGTPDSADAALDELAPNGGGTSGNHGNGTAG